MFLMYIFFSPDIFNKAFGGWLRSTFKPSAKEIEETM